MPRKPSSDALAHIHPKLRQFAKPIANLVLDPQNPRGHSAENIAAIRESLREHGQVRAAIVTREELVLHEGHPAVPAGTILVGNGMVTAAREMGWKWVAAIEFEGGAVEARKLALRDNRTAELASWIVPNLLADLRSLESLQTPIADLGWADDALKELQSLSQAESLSQPTHSGEDPGAQPDRAAELQAKWQTASGQLWEIPSKAVKGKVHRLLCGDCRRPEDVARLMAGERVNIAFTSPPYASQRKYDEASGFKPIPPDEYVDWFEAVQANVLLHLASDGSWFVNIKEHAEDGERHTYVLDLVLAHKRRWGWMFVDTLCWVRAGVPGGWPNRFKNSWEPVFHFSTQTEIKFRPEAVSHPTEHAFDYSTSNGKSVSGSGLLGKEHAAGFREGLARPGNVIEIGSGGAKVTGEHPAEFPVGLPRFFLLAYSDPGDLVYEPFAGSGTTLVAAEQEGRVGRGIEISPRYVAVALERLSGMGLTPRLLK